MQTAVGGLNRGVLQGLDRGLVEMPLSRTPKGVGKHQETGQGKAAAAEHTFEGCPRVMTVSTALPCPPLCPGSPRPGPLCVHLQRSLRARSCRTKTFWSRYHIGDNSAVCPLLCRVSVMFYFWLQVSGTRKQMFLRMFLKLLF